MFKEKFNLNQREVSALCKLMLRGPQTVGEIRVHAERMCKFEGLKEVDEILQGLMEREQPMVVRLPRQTGRKECRYMHLLSGKPEIQETGRDEPFEVATLQVQAENERISKLEEELATLRSEFDSLKQMFIKFQSQLE